MFLQEIKTNRKMAFLFGGQASTNIYKNQLKIVEEAYNTCKGPAISQNIDLSGLDFSCPEYCQGKCGDINIQNAATAEASCIVSSQQDSLATLITTLNAKAKAGLGYSVSTNKSDIKQDIQQKIDSECSGTSEDQKINAKNAIMKTCGNVSFMNNASAKTQCQLGAIQKILSDVDSKIQSTSTGFDPTAIIGIFAFIALIAVLVYANMKGMFKSKFGQRRAPPPKWVFSKRN